MRVTGVPNCCASAFVCSDAEFSKALELAGANGATAGLTLGGAYYNENGAANGQRRWGTVEGPIPFSMVEKKVLEYGWTNPGGNQESSVALASSLMYSEDPKAIEEQVKKLSNYNYPTLVMAIAREGFLSTKMFADGWRAIIQWPAAHGGGDLILFVKPRKNGQGYGGTMKLLPQPTESPSKDAKKAGEQLQEIAKEQLQQAVAAAKMPDPVAEVKIDYKVEPMGNGGWAPLPNIWAPVPDLMYANQQNALYGGAQPIVPVPPPVQKWTPVMEARVRRLRKRAEKPPTQEVITRARRFRARRIAP